MKEIKLDKRDKQIIYELDQNSRQPLAKIAKKLKLNRNVILYRVNRLKEVGVIKYAFAEINSIGLGYHSFRILMKLGNFTAKQKRDLTEYLLSQKKLIWFCSVIGPWDIDIVYTVKQVLDFESFRQELFLLFNSIIEDFKISLLSSIYVYPRDYLIDKKRTHVPKLQFGLVDFVCDEKDMQILHLLTKDASQNILDLAKAVNLSINTVKKRLKALEKNNIILKYRLFIDTAKLGYIYYKLHLTLRNYKKEDLAAVRSFLESKNFVIYIDRYITAEDFEIELNFKTEDGYLAFIDELNENFGRIIKNHFVLRFHQEKLFRYLPEE